MSRKKSFLPNIFAKSTSVPPGVYHYIAPPEDERNYRLHLRVDPDGNGVLIVNASTILHLNQTATHYAYYLVQNTPADIVAKEMSKRYHVTPQQAGEDYIKISEQIQTLIETPDIDPVTFLGFERQVPFTGNLSAPYRLDCALTYKTREKGQDFAPVDRVKSELSTEDWKKVFEKAWKAGIPQIIFTGGEPTLREDLSQLIAHCEGLGQVTGLISDGFAFLDNTYLSKILNTGLDFLMLIFQEDDDDSWNIIQNCLIEDLYLSVHLTLTKGNQNTIHQTIHKLVEIGVHAISVSAESIELQPKLSELRRLIADLGLELVWNLPVPYSQLHPVALEMQSVEIPPGAGKAWLYVEPDGDVLPMQGLADEVLGNLLTDSWESIWRNCQKRNPS